MAAFDIQSSVMSSIYQGYKSLFGPLRELGCALHQMFSRLHMTMTWLILGLVLGAEPALAALGQAHAVALASSSPSMPAVRVFAGTSVARSALFTLHPLQLENGTLVQEYATPTGVVFAVSWRGPVLPDLSLMLGEYFSRFKGETDQARALGKRGSPVNLVSDKLVVRSGGRMRSFVGYAYVPKLVPAGVNINDVLQ